MAFFHSIGRCRLALAAVLTLLSGALAAPGAAQQQQQERPRVEDKFRQLEGEAWPAPTMFRSASGAPGPAYWQQQVDYRIEASLDEATRSVTGRATVTYRNNSPDTLPYLWLLLDQNRFKRDSIAERTRTVERPGEVEEGRRAAHYRQWEGGFSDLRVTDAGGRPLRITIADTLMRVDLPAPLASGASISFDVEWRFPLIDTRLVGGRSGYECMGSDQGADCIFLAAQWFPRLAAYSDFEGWHIQPFLGAGEFALEFGNYDVSLTVPGDHVVAATGVLANPRDVLTAEQRSRLDQARSAAAPVYVVTPEEAARAENGRASGVRTWRFHAENVRDFAVASSRSFIWDAMGVAQQDPAMPLVMAMSFYPRQAQPLWNDHSTRSIAHALRVYGELAFPYPYPVAQAVNGPVDGMEYPMITFNDPRPRKDGSIGEVSAPGPLNSLVGINIHEIGHIWFSMIVNTDERQWSWLDEGVNSLVQHLAEKRWDPAFLSRLGGEPQSVVKHMTRSGQSPIMTQSDSQRHYFTTSYIKTATALSILRRTVLGPEAFDRALGEYARRWRFKRPTPYDFFRTMEESSGTDLDWFWRGWFYGTGHVDIALETIVRAKSEASDTRFHHFTFRNVGGIVMPVILKIRFADGSSETIRIPAEIWRYNPDRVTWQYDSSQPIVGAEIDPDLETADTDRTNNSHGAPNAPAATATQRK